MDSSRVPLTSLPYLFLGLAIAGLIVKRIWAGQTGHPGLDRMLGQSLEPRWRQIFHTIAIAVFAVFFVAHAWLLGVAPQYSNASTGEVRAWTYAERAYYLTSNGYAVLHDIEIAAGLMFAAFAAEMLWRQRRKQ